MNKTYYDILEVSQHASGEVITSAYRALSKRYHPDKNIDSPSSNDAMTAVNRAYEVLSDPIKRKAYDATFFRSASNTTQPNNSDDSTSTRNKACPICGEEILEVAKKCKHCGADLVIKPSPIIGVYRWLSGVYRWLSKFAMGLNYSYLLGIFGSLIFIAGYFAPAFDYSTSGIGAPEYVDTFYALNSLIVLALPFAVVSIVLTIRRKYGALWITGSGCLAIVLYTYYAMKSEIQLMGGLVGGRDVASILSWGWGVLVIGSLLIIASPVVKKLNER